jgi:hypothetical protein
VIIGYIFRSGDHWGSAAEKIVHGSEEIHSSTFVIRECFGTENGGKYGTIKSKILKEFRRAIAFLRLNPSSSNLLTEARARSWRIYGILDDLVQEYPTDSNLVLQKLRNSQIQYEIDCNNRSEIIQNGSLIQLHTRDQPYTNIWTLLRPHVNDDDDLEVILDAHHVGHQIRNLALVTGDWHNIASQKTIIISNSKIADILFLGHC